MTDSLRELTAEVLAFRDERDWGQFHTLRHLVAGLVVEASEMQELLLWKTDEDVTEAMSDLGFRQRLWAELADVTIYALMIAERSGIDLGSAVKSKLAANGVKYPVSLSRGSSKKYTELTEGKGP